MNTATLVAAREKAEEAVAAMPDGPLKVKAFEVILGALLAGASPTAAIPSNQKEEDRRRQPAVSLPDRIEALAQEGFLSEPRSLSEVQVKLAEHGWHYPQTNLSTPLVRLVRQRRLRRLPAMAGGKRIWKYSLP